MRERILLTSIPLDDLVDEIKRVVRAEVAAVGAGLESEPEKLLTRKEAAHYLSITLPTLGLYTKQGRLRGYRVGRRILYRRSELISCLRPLQFSRSGNR